MRNEEVNYEASLYPQYWPLCCGWWYHTIPSTPKSRKQDHN